MKSFPPEYALKSAVKLSNSLNILDRLTSKLMSMKEKKNQAKTLMKTNRAFH